MSDPTSTSVRLLADQLGIDPAAVTVVSSRAVTWGDGSIGCPREGFFYTQALVDGHRIELVVDGATYVFHQGGAGQPFHCPDPQEPLSTES